jgi:hypothetical protein
MWRDVHYRSVVVLLSIERLGPGTDHPASSWAPSCGVGSVTAVKTARTDVSHLARRQSKPEPRRTTRPDDFLPHPTTATSGNVCPASPLAQSQKDPLALSTSDHSGSDRRLRETVTFAMIASRGRKQWRSQVPDRSGKPPFERSG